MKYIKEAIKIFFEKKNMIYFFKIYSVSLVTGLILFAFNYIMINQGYSGTERFLYIPSIILLPISLWTIASGYEAVRRVVGGGLFKFKDTYKTSLKYLWKFFLASFLVGIIVIGGFILLIVPGAIFAIWFMFSTWGVVDKNLDIIQSLKESKKLVKGKFWRVAVQSSVIFLFSFIVHLVFSSVPKIGPLVSTIFGGLFLLPYYLLYRDLQQEGNI